MKVEDYLRDRYLENKNMTSWLPQRFNDLVYRMDTQYEEQPGMPPSKDFIFLWEEGGDIVACILPDGDAVYMSIKSGYEPLFSEMLVFAEENLTPLFQRDEDGCVDFLVIANDSLTYRAEILAGHGYFMQEEKDYDNYCYPREMTGKVDLPEGYKLVYGEEIADEERKWTGCHMGFHPEAEKEQNYKISLAAYDARKKSSMYGDSFESLVVTCGGDICSYSFCYVDKKTGTGFIEPVSTREKYRHKGIGSAMMAGIILRLKEVGIEKCYVNSYDWRKKFYNAAGFITEDSIGYWHKKLL